MVIEILAVFIIYCLMYIGLAKMKDYEWDKKDKKFKDWTSSQMWERASERPASKPWWED